MRQLQQRERAGQPPGVSREGASVAMGRAGGALKHAR
eukprot:COSAG01_NODE_3250_length_6353_cov_445.752958_2_plen_37_part_00